jgi:DNA invertase Pin-like site-specific DNA recombinase
MPKAISYVRFSSLHQGRGSTVERQEQMIRDWLVSNPDYEPSRLSRVDRGLSGYKAEHLAEGGGLKAIQDAIQDGQIVKGDVLLVEAVDRLGRLNHVEMTALIGGILGAGVDIVTLDDNQRYTFERLNSDGAWLLTGKIQQAHSYSDALSRRITKSYESRREKASKGEPIRIAKALWLDQNGKLKEPESKMVKTAIEHYKDGKGTRAIVAALKVEFGAIAPKDAKSITRWLTTRALVGEWQGYKVFDALLEHSEFLELQRLFESRRLIGKPPESFFLSGLIKCGRCGKSFNVRRQKPKPTKDAPIGSEAYLSKPQILYANCRSYLKNSSCDNNVTWPLEVLEFIMNQTSDDVLIGIAEGRAISSVTAKALNELEAERTTLEQQISRLQDLYLDTGENFLRQKAKTHKERLEMVKREIEGLKQITIYPKASELSYEELENLRDEHHEKAQKEYNQILGDKKSMKSLLKMYGYSIQIDGRQAYCPDSSESETFILGKRRQKFGCYIVEIKYPENDKTRFAAIRRTEPVTWDDSEIGLLAKLEAAQMIDLST